jgi:diguanylate cyclase (GGDEF)-like protein/PAS domain S-box-containing protein
MAENTAATILIVDDVQENLMLLSRILANNGYKVETIDNGAEAIVRVQASLPDIILLDINMPSVDGYEVCQRLKKDERTRGIPIIFVSALDSIGNKVRAFQAGGVDYIPKPFEIEEVRARVETHLGIVRLRRQLQTVNEELAARVEELVRSQALLGERERKLSAFVRALPNLSFVLDQEGRVLEVMANEPSLLFARPEHIKGRLIQDFIPPEAADQIMGGLHQALETGRATPIEYQVPVLAGGEHWFEGRFALMEQDEQRLSKVILTAAEISDRRRLYQEVQRLANQDPLTSCFNRRHFMSLAEQEVQRATRYRRPLSLLMLDLDHFKDFNDLYGHQIGDRLLCALVDLCQQQLRSVDTLGRYGGEEFVILMPETVRSGAAQAAERIRAAIADLELDTAAGQLSVTVSVGVASIEPRKDPTPTLDALIKRADQALYKAKSDGRNCVRTG